MSNRKVTEDQIAVVRSVVGGALPDMDIIRALHVANNDPTAAINIIFDSPTPPPPPSHAITPVPSPPHCRTDTSRRKSRRLLPPPCPHQEASPLLTCRPDDDGSPPPSSTLSGVSPPSRGSGDNKASVSAAEDGDNWWLISGCDLAGLSTCKGRRLKAGDSVDFCFPSAKVESSSPLTSARFPSRGRPVVSCSEIVRFCTRDSGEIGRIPNEWARCLMPLVKSNLLRIEGCCKSAPEDLSIMDTVILSVSVYINVSVLGKHHEMPPKYAEFTPEDLLVRKRSLETKGPQQVQAIALSPEKYPRFADRRNNVENEDETIPDDMDNIVGIAVTTELEEMEPPDTLRCELRPYQKQALHWMVQLEKERFFDEAATTLHPCWNAYCLRDKRELVLYLNTFSGEATTRFPSTLQMARGGILADAMGLGKTVMTISLLLACSGKGGPFASSSQSSVISDDIIYDCGQSLCASKKITSISSFNKLMKCRPSLVGGGNLIICPMTLLGQWKAEIETHAQLGSLSIFVHYGQSRPKDAKLLARYDVVLTTYGVLSSEFSAENSEENGGLYSVNWFRIVLDEAHTIKSPKSQISLAAAALTSDRRWCLTGTPIQNNLEDMYSLLRFLRVEPWGNSGLWYKLIQKPYEEGDQRGLKLVQSILKPIMLRRTKFSMDKQGRPILVLPPVNAQVIYCEFSEAEKDFYDALFRRSKVKFDQFVEQGRVLHNYASILELLLRLRQCCDHPFLVMSRSDTQEFSDLNKLTTHFLRYGPVTLSDHSKYAPSKAYVEEVVEELRKGEKGECPICLEAFEDAVLTPCAHCLCRECLLASWRNTVNGPCPICRKIITKSDLITAPTDSRFQVDIENNWIESSKVSMLLKELENLRSSGSKSIVFSQWTAFLDLLQVPFS
ncbi:hypothetical protein Taro_005364, partial [Colocasia esculenta]|nr:hypothetical protein [Colocasia esculenta]